MNLENPGYRLMKYQGKLLYFSLTLSGSSATSHKIQKHIATDYAIRTTKDIFKKCIHLPIYQSSITCLIYDFLHIFYLLPYSKNDLGVLQIKGKLRVNHFRN